MFKFVWQNNFSEIDYIGDREAEAVKTELLLCSRLHGWKVAAAIVFHFFLPK